MIKPGENIGGCIIEGVLDRNSAGPLYSGTRAGQSVIVGVLSFEDPPLITRYLAEAQAFAKLQHPSIPKVLGFGRDSGRTYAVWETPPGEDLASLEKSGRFVPFDRKISAAVQLAGALQHIHDASLLHRHVEPKNIVFAQDGKPVLTKYEFAENEGEGRFIKPTFYSSPEQVRNRETDGSGDQFSLAGVLYEWMTGRRPFEGDTIPAALTEIISGQHTPLSTRLPGCAPDLAAILDRALDKRAANRFPSIQSFGDALEAFRQTLPSHVDALRAEVKRLEDEIEAGVRTMAALGLASVEELEEVRRPGAVPAGDAGDTGDYGVLLVRTADLARRFEILAARLRAGLPVLGLLREAQEQFEEGKLDGCEESLRKLFEISPDHAIGRQFLESCNVARHRRLSQKVFRERSALMLGQVRDALERRQPVLSLLGAQAILECEPGHPEASALREESEKMRDAGGSGRRERVKELLEVCRARLRAGDYDAALKISEELFKLSPDLRDAIDLRRPPK